MRRATAAILLCLATALPAAAGETYELFFRPGTLTAADGTAVGEELTYDGLLVGPTAVMGEESYTVALLPGTEGRTTLVRRSGDRDRVLGSFDTATGNPVIMYFMESTLRQMAEITGGSPFYIRNRIKDALLGAAVREPVTFVLDGAAIAATRVTIRPFADDAARNRMGAFADLALSVTVAEAIPGWYGRLEARTPPEGPEPFANLLTLTVPDKEALPQ